MERVVVEGLVLVLGEELEGEFSFLDVVLLDKAVVSVHEAGGVTNDWLKV